eukprot:1463853-Rhodomonas_salina.2
MGLLCCRLQRLSIPDPGQSLAAPTRMPSAVLTYVYRATRALCDARNGASPSCSEAVTPRSCCHQDF